MGQKAALGGMIAALLAALFFNAQQLVENRHLMTSSRKLKADIARLDTRINHPTAGYVVKLAQAQTNTAVCTTAVERRNVLIREQAKRSAAAVAAVQQRYDAEHRARVRAERDAAAFLARKPQGETVLDRVLDVDARILGDLK